MSIRLRFAFCYGTLFALILPLMTVLSYAIHARGQYDDIDRMLIVRTEHAASEVTSTSRPHLLQREKGFEIALHLYSSTGVLQDQTLGTAPLPSVDPRAILHTPTRPAFDPIVGLFPPLMGSPPVIPDATSAFSLINTSEQRWRVYVLPFHTAQGAGYLEAVTPLGRLDASIQAFRMILPLLGLTSLFLALLGSWAIAGNALRPITRMIQTAQTITLSRDLSRRIEMPAHHDELGRLAATFNELLASVEAAHRTQQRLVADASHELRAPLTAILGNIELLHHQQNMPAGDREEALAELEREATRLSRLVADLLMLARADAGIGLKRRPIDVDLLVLDAFHEARHLAQGQTLRLGPFEPAHIEGDEDRLKQLLLILLDNALKYTPAGGEVVLGLRPQEERVDILVRDTGVGIAPEALPHVFERFYRADPARSRDPGGTGLGLPIAQWIVEQHQGTIRLESQPGQGTLVTVRLPLG
ncbi:two-component sensor histidine kinase [Ktedonobacter sp. SOSP1-85]|uniref:sensor histidine kinase n=1 Tax=Ktedonobacter sp. SOSP1-85 TaxID=2778367 RepID=UPI001916A848|nr:HAMP domain-containing sensor histidine kinase [Ktedonobacter sp. SOSP1-85]GHO80179.1 two-component sensor histidine kinase [Ktedonobacter sp. SOSP1-85]